MTIPSSQSFLSAPCHDYLYHNSKFSPVHLSDNGKAFLSSKTGFIPAQPLPFLPYPYSGWHNLAKSLPALCKSNDWQAFVDNLPEISAADLPDEHLLRSNIALGAIAHAIRNIGNMEIPAVIMNPWTNIAKRLGRPTPCLPSLDLLVYNVEHAYETLPTSTASTSSDSDSDHESYSEVAVKSIAGRFLPSLTLTGSLAEANYIIKGHSVERAAGPLPGIVAAAHQAVIAKDDIALREQLIRMINVTEEMTLAFTSADPRPLSDCFMDHVEWGRSIDVSAFPVVDGEKTGSGLLFPSIHLLDVFFSRKQYESEMGQLARKDRPWLPALHQGFFDAVEQISVLDYILSDENGNMGEMLCVFRRALAAFASEKGLMGKHRIRLTGYLEAMFKCGRKETGNGLSSSGGWEERIWRRISHAMLQSMRERTAGHGDWYHNAVVRRCVPVQQNQEVYQLVIDSNGALVYKPGDHIAIIPQNSDELVQLTLDVLRITGDEMIYVTNNTWIGELKNRGTHCEIRKEDGRTCLQVRARDFLRMSSLQPLDTQVAEKLIDSFSVVSSSMIEHLCHTRATNIPTVLQMLLRENPYPFESLIKKLDYILEPLAPRCYSVTSHMSESPRSVEIVVGRVRYEPEDLLWPNSSEMLGVSSGDSDSKKFTSAPMHRNMVAQDDHALRDISRKTMKSHLNKDIGAVPSHFARNHAVLEGVCSSFLSRLVPGSTLTARIIPELDFHMPRDRHTPIIMISIGTGVAPFKSFLRELIRQKHEFGMPAKRAWLILGVKSTAHIPFREDIEEAVCKEKVAHLSLAFSREDVDLDPQASVNKLIFRPGTRKRLFEMVEDNPTLVDRMWNMICDDGHIYVCGNPDLEPATRKMIASVLEQCDQTSRFLLSEGKKVEAKEYAEERADKLMANKRIHVDCFSSGKPKHLENNYTHADVAEHHTIASCWVTFRGFVYDLTRYLQVHPGGPKILLDKAGRDMTTDFNVAHGDQNLRVESMMEPYKIGYLRRFTTMNERTQKLMEEWSLPLLYGVLERRSVFMLDWNSFAELKEPPSFKEWKSHHSSDRAVSELCQKFWNVYEPDMFGFFQDSLNDEKFTDLLKFKEKDTGTKQDFKMLTEEIKCFRTKMLGRKKIAENMRGLEATQFLQRCSTYMKEYCRFAIELQRIVERGLQSDAS